MKVKHVLIIAAVLLAMFVMPAFGAEQDSTVTYDAGSVAYTVLIPSAIDFSDGDSVAIDYAKLEESTTLSVSVKSNGDWKLTPENGASNTYGYDMFIGGSTNAAVNDDVVVSVVAGSVSASVKDASDDDVTAAVSFELDNGVTIKTAGKFTDTLTFTISIDASEGAVLTTVYADTVDDLKNVLNNVESATIKLMEDVTVTETLTITAGKKFTLDLNGHTISGTCNSGQGWLMLVENSAILTIKDSIGSGKLKFTKGTSDTGWVIDLEGELVLESGTIELAGNGWNIGYCVDVRPNAWGTAYTEPTIFTMKGGKLVSSDGAVRVASSSSDTYSDVSASFVMNNGEIDAVYDGIFIQQSDAAYDTLSFTMSGGSITSDNYLIRFYGPEPTSYISGNNECMSLTLNVDMSALTGPAEPLTGKTWLIENVIALGGGMTTTTISNTVTMTVDSSFNYP